MIDEWTIAEQITVPAYEARAVRLREGDRLRVSTPEGARDARARLRAAAPRARHQSLHGHGGDPRPAADLEAESGPAGRLRRLRAADGRDLRLHLLPVAAPGAVADQRRRRDHSDRDA